MSTDPIEWARAEAKRLRGVAGNTSGTDRNLGYLLKPTGSAALEFLRIQAGGTHFHSDADGLFGTANINAIRTYQKLATILDLWADFVEAGMAGALPYDAQARIDAATDLMGQVQLLLADPKVHSAAPVVLAGAALEEFLRSRLATTGATVSGKPGINTYATALKAAGDLSAAEVKDITAWAGQRNEAAHGEFANLSKQRAQIMVDGINLFMQKRTVTTP